MQLSKIKDWKWAIWGAFAITLLSLYPQLLMWGAQGREWNGSYAEIHGDEWVYSAYVQALIDGRPRRNDPYTGRDDQPGNSQPESLFSIQFVPAYSIALPARVLGLSSSTAFILLGVLAPFLACLSIVWLLFNLTQDHRLAAAGSVIVLCLGGVAAGEGVAHLLVSGFQYSFVPFLRKYEPAAPFPLFFLFCGFVWKSTQAHGRRAFGWALISGITVVLLIFSYFYLWTSALAWLACLAVLLVIADRANLRRQGMSFLTIGLLALGGLVPYVLLLARRSATMDAGQKLTISHAPDFFRVPELLGLVVIIMIVVAQVRGRINWRASESLFTLSFALLPLVVFNQQIITGRSLQPFHYESFIANYIALIGVTAASVIIWRGREGVARPIRFRVVGWLVFIAVWWAGIEIMAPTNVIKKDNQFIDRAAAVCQRLRERGKTDQEMADPDSDSRPLVLASENKVAVILPTFAPQAVLWAPHFDFLNLEPGESRARFYEYLYYTGVDGDKMAKDLREPLSSVAAAAFGHERVIPDLAVQTKLISDEEIASQVSEYKTYYSSFSRERALQHILSYVIVPVEGGPDLSNLDRWYERDQGERVGDHLLYRVQLRPSVATQHILQSTAPGVYR
jgi:hypothetical protein